MGPQTYRSMLRGLDVARLTRASRIRCRPGIFHRPLSTTETRSKPSTSTKSKAEVDEDGIEGRSAFLARRSAEKNDYELARHLQRENVLREGSSALAQREKSGGRTLPSLKNRKSFKRASRVDETVGRQDNSGVVDASPSSSAPPIVSEPPSGASSPSSTSSSNSASSASTSTASSSTTSSSSSSTSASSISQTLPSRKGKEKATEEIPLRRNPAGVQLLSPSLHRQLFPGAPLPDPPRPLIQLSADHLEANGLKAQDAATLPEINFELPPLRGSDIRDHFHALGRQEAEPYLSIAHRFAQTDVPEMPENWATECPGWVKYHPDGSYEPVQDLGDEEVVSFDVETLYKLSPYPVIATAVTPNAWYSWLCPTIFEPPPSRPIQPKPRWDRSVDPHLPHDLIPMFDASAGKERLVIGHNVGYDRARIKDEYSLAPTPTRFLDTLSLHVATRGITSVQRPTWMKHRNDRRAMKLEERTFRETTLEVLRELNPDWAETLTKEDEQKFLDGPEESPVSLNEDGNGDTPFVGPKWEDVTSVNSLKEVAALHCGHSVDKSIRDTFGDDTILHPSQLQAELHDLVKYCADDVKITHDVFKKVFPLFVESCPHPASFAGALNMGSAILPVDERWGQYIKNAEETYRKMEEDVATSLRSLAEKLRLEGPTPGDPWHAQLDWKEKKARWTEVGDDAPLAAKKARAAAAELVNRETGKLERATALAERPDAPPTATDSSPKPEAAESAEPEWYSEFIKPDFALSQEFEKLTLPLLLRMTYQGYPVVRLKEHMWCFRVPKSEAPSSLTIEQPHGEAVTPADNDLPAIRGWADDYLFFRISKKGKPRKLKLVGPGAKPLLKQGLSGEDPEVTQQAIQGPLESVSSSVGVLARKLLKADQTDVWRVQLEQRYANASSPKGKASSADTEKDREMWPAWYWDLTKPVTQLPPGELDLTQKKSITPLLLRLQWEGFPLVLSKNYRWLYRVPASEVLRRGFTNDGLVVGLGAPVNWNESSKSGDEHLSEDRNHYYFRLPHTGGEGKNVGNPLAKGFVKSLETGRLSATTTGEDDVASSVAAGAIKMNVLCAYWISARERIMEQMVVYDSPTSGYILPQVITMGTVTRRAVESTWLTASNAKKNRVGSELKAMVRAPPGYALVGADVDSEELWISSVMGDSQFGMHGATAIGWMTLEGTKSAGTDLHSKTASILGTSRDAAKVFNYSRIYGAGVKHAVQLLMQGDGTLTKDAATEKAKALYAATKGEKSMRNRQLSPAAAPSLWHGGSESFLFNTLESIALSDRPTTPALGCGVTKALSRSYLEAINEYLPSRINWVVQSSGVDYLHLLIVSMSYLIKRYNIDARYLISVHDEVRYLVKEEDKYRAALALQIANAWTRALFCYNLGIDDVPQGVTFFSAVDIDHVLRKEVNMPCVTPSHPTEIPSGHSLDIDQLLAITATLGEPTSYDVQREYIPAQSTEAPVTLFPNIRSQAHYRYLQAQAERHGARAQWWLDNQRSTLDPQTGEARPAPVRRALGRGKEARVDRMRNATRFLGDHPDASEIREALAAFEEESRRGWRMTPAKA